MKNNRTFKSSNFLRLAGLSAVFAALPAMAVQPEIVEDSVSIGHKENSPLVEISYTLTGEPAVVTVKIETNTLADASGDWVSIGCKGTGFLGGEANKVVYTLGESVKAYWNPVLVFGSRTFDSGAVRAVVTAWSTNMPPDYMVADLQNKLATRYYASTNDLPGGFEDTSYKTTKLLMRKIPAKNVVWWMGSPTRIGDTGWESTNDVPHKVMLTKDYYAGVYEVTIGQLKNVGAFDFVDSVKISEYTNSPVANLTPAENIGHYINELRGKFSEYAFVKTDHTVAPNSIIDLFRSSTGIVDLDLPTEAQWEYACRAGSGSVLPGNIEYDETSLKLIAVKLNAAYYHDVPVKRNGPAPVGSRIPNDWGLYDMVGNVAEICLDMIGINSGSSTLYLDEFHASLNPEWKKYEVTTDPKGANFDNTNNKDEDRNMVRGGSWRDDYPLTSAFKRNQQKNANMPNGGYRGSVGVRLFCSVKEAVK